MEGASQVRQAQAVALLRAVREINAEQVGTMVNTCGVRVRLTITRM
jgi:hypothetical protein